MLSEINEFVNWLRRRNPAARTWRDYGYDLRQFADMVGDRPPNALTFRDIDRFVSLQAECGFQPATVNRRLALRLPAAEEPGDHPVAGLLEQIAEAVNAYERGLLDLDRSGQSLRSRDRAIIRRGAFALGFMVFNQRYPDGSGRFLLLREIHPPNQ